MQKDVANLRVLTTGRAPSERPMTLRVCRAQTTPACISTPPNAKALEHSHSRLTRPPERKKKPILDDPSNKKNWTALKQQNWSERGEV